MKKTISDDRFNPIKITDLMKMDFSGSDCKNAFRAWDTKKEVMIHHPDLLWRSEGIFIFDWGKYDQYKKQGKDDGYAYYNSRELCYTSRFKHPDQRWILMQNTGLVDKNERIIWEGDLFKLGSNSYSVVEYDKNWASFMLNDTVGLNDIVQSRMEAQSNSTKVADDMEIAGNIYENPCVLT